jgi:DnaJ family protein A protein 3
LTKLLENEELIELLPQAYAELEKDTPGQIFGITFKSDGKSSTSEPISEKFTQRPTNEDTFYEEHDKTGSQEYQKSRVDARAYFWLGFLGIFILAVMLTSSKTEDILEYERDKTLAEQQLRQQNKQRSPFDEA